MAESDFSRGAGEKSAQDCWTLMTRAEKVLLFLLVLAVFAVIGLAAFIIVHFLAEQDCDTHECIKASYELLRTIDFETDPCTNFHDFICGNYEHIPVYEEKKVDLVTDDLHEDDSHGLQTVKKFYQACTNTTAIEEDEENSLFNLISRTGGWPILMGKDWKDENFHWLRFMVEVRPWGIRSDWLLNFDYYEDEKNHTNLLMIGPPKLQPTAINQFIGNFYEESILQLAAKFESTQFDQKQLTQMMHFESNLSRITENARNREGDSRKITTVAAMNEIWPQVLLFEILNDLARGFAVFTNNTPIVVASENYIYELHKLITIVPKRTQANYFIWKAIQNYLPFLSEDLRETYGKYYKSESREEHCHTETIRRFYSVIEDEYVEKYKSRNTPTVLKSMMNLIYQSYDPSDDDEVAVVIDGPEGKNSGVTSIDFLSDKIIRMINDIQFHIDNEFYKCLHKNYTCVKEGYYEDTEKLTTYFDPSNGTIHLPYNLVYSEIFRWDRPNYINFAKIGRIVGDKIKEAEEERFNTTLDIVGVEMAYEGYRQWLQTKGMDSKLPALNYTIKQLFWMYTSVTFCHTNDSEKFQEVENSQYFREDFECM